MFLLVLYYHFLFFPLKIHFAPHPKILKGEGVLMVVFVPFLIPPIFFLDSRDLERTFLKSFDNLLEMCVTLNIFL